MTFGSGAYGCLGHGNCNDVSQVCLSVCQSVCLSVCYSGLLVSWHVPLVPVKVLSIVRLSQSQCCVCYNFCSKIIAQQWPNKTCVRLGHFAAVVAHSYPSVQADVIISLSVCICVCRRGLWRRCLDVKWLSSHVVHHTCLQSLMTMRYSHGVAVTTVCFAQCCVFVCQLLAVVCLSRMCEIVVPLAVCCLSVTVQCLSFLCAWDCATSLKSSSHYDDDFDDDNGVGDG